MVIKNVMVFTEDNTFREGSIILCGDRIENVVFGNDGINDSKNGADHDCMIDGHGYYAVPGMTDLHFHGCNGYDLCDGTLEAMDEIAKFQAEVGVTTIAPATMTLPVPELEHILSAAACYRERQNHGECAGRADFVGINMEGPFISAAKKGAQDEKYIRVCDTELYKRFQKAASGLVKIIGIAPEVHEPETFIRTVKSETVVSIAHSGADYETAKKAIGAGVSHIVHLFNGMSGLHHREPGIIGAALENETVTAEIICDGQHIHPAMIRMTFELFGRDRLILISDSMRAAGLKDGTYTLGGQKVNVQGNRAVMVKDGVLAGSVTPLPNCVKYLVTEVGIPLETAICCAAVNPAKRLGIFDQYGSIAKGKKANILLMDGKANIVNIFKDGILLTSN